MTVPDRMDERLRALRLREAERMAEGVFTRAVKDGVIAPGRYESEVDSDIRDIARRVAGPLLGGEGRLVRSGPHTALPTGQAAPDRLIAENDVAVVDLSPLLAAHETSFAQTVVLGDDPRRHRLVEDLRGLFTDGREAFRSRENITGGQLHAQVLALAAKAGWELTTWHVGRLTGSAVGDAGDTTREEELIAPHNSTPLRRRDQAGFPAHWVMEIQLVDEHRGFGGTLKQLLDLV
ncbi:M24 family metallopeptidase [Streptomyces tanashiensis]|uniref:M24 family metallopeptidase n=1 Tax=Streptomyces tanashiensis TaxID=67367 RepID=UPI0036B41376